MQAMEYNERELVVARISPMDAATSKTLGNHSHVVRPAEMEWKKTRFPGCDRVYDSFLPTPSIPLV
jgi:hypothetical protein